MSVHWTEYPERIETFGDLLSILETLDRHERESGFTAPDFQPERQRRTAYTVDFHNRRHQFHPRFDQMPGLERLLDRFDIDGYPTLTQSQARELRRRAAQALNRDGASLNAMIFTDIAEALDMAARQPESASANRSQSGNPAPAQPTVTPSRAALDEACQLTLAALRAARTLPIHREHFSHESCTPTLRERCETVSDDIRAAREAVVPLVLVLRAATRYVADRPFCNKFWSSAHEAAVEAANDLLWRFRPECGDPGEHPEDRVYAALESEVEKEHAATVARFCASQQEIVPSSERLAPRAVLGDIEPFGERQNIRAAEGSVARTSAQQVNIRPVSAEPPRRAIEAAMLELPSALNNAPQPQGVHDPNGRRGADYAVLRRCLEAASHNRDAAEWAIHNHAEAGRLEAVPGTTSTPGVVTGGEWAVRPVTNHPYDRAKCVLWANPTLWEWWQEKEAASVMESVVVAPNEKSPPLPPDGYTMGDIRDLLRYQRELARFEDWRHRTHKPVLSIDESLNRTHALALSTPQAGRLTAERAAGLATYRRLVKLSHDTFSRDLDEPALLYFVGEVAETHGRSVEEMWPLSPDEFRQLTETRPQPKEPPGGGATANASENTGDPKGSNDPDRNIGGRPPLGEGPNATAQERARRNAYELVRKVYRPGFGPVKLREHFRKEKDFKDLVRQAGNDFNNEFFRVAIAWIKENPDQETQSGNVS